MRPAGEIVSRPALTPLEVAGRITIGGDTWVLHFPYRSKRKNGLIVPTCDVCGRVGRKLRSTGLRGPVPGATVEGERLRIHRNGRPVHATEPAPALRTLHASRCVGCGHDQVLDTETNELWDLDDSDYGPDGSVAP